MATQREDVVVNLKVNAGDGLTQINTGIQQTQQSTSNLNASVGDVSASIGSLITGAVKASFVMRIFNKVNLENVVIGKQVQQVTKQMTGTQDKAVKFITGKSIPSYGQLAKVLGVVGGVVLGLVVAFKAWTASLSTTEEGSDDLAAATTGLDIVFTTFIKSMGEAGLGLNNFFKNILEGLAFVNPALGTFVDTLKIAKTVGGELNEQQKISLALQIKRVEATAERATSISQIQTEMKKENLTMEQQLDLADRLGNLQAEAAESRIAEIDSQVLALKQQQDKTTTSFTERRKMELQIQQLILQRDLMELKGSEILDRRDIQLQNIRDSYKEVAEEVAKLEGKDALTFFGDDTSQFTEQGRSLLDVFSGIQSEFEQDVIDGHDAIEELEDEHVEVMDAMAEKQARNRIKWQELGAVGQLNILGDLFGSASTMAEQNFELQKAFAIGEVLISTAAGIIRVWRDPGYPVAIPLTAAVAAQGLASIASIQSAQAGQTGTALNPLVTSADTRPPRSIESAQNTFFQNNQTIAPVQPPVLVTEDLSVVQNRVAVTEDRATLG